MWDDIPYVPTTILRWFSREIKFENCTDYRKSGRRWCATKVTSSNRYVPGYWGECPDTLPCNAIEGKKSFQRQKEINYKNYKDENNTPFQNV